MQIKIITAVVAGLFVSGCASIEPNSKSLAGSVHNQIDEKVQSVANDYDSKKHFGLKKLQSKDELPNSAKVNPKWDSDLGTMSVSSSGSLSSVIGDVAARSNYLNVVYVDGVDKNKAISISLKNTSPEYALRKIALAAGYVAVIDRKSKTVTISDQAAYTFKVPSNVFNQLIQTMTSDYAIGSSANNGGSAPPGLGGGSTGGTGNAQFNVQGKTSSSTQGGGAGGGMAGGGGVSMDAGMTAFIKSIAGKNADVTVNPYMGMITVRSNGVALERVKDTLNKMVEVASRRVAVEATFLEVSLGDTFQYGIDWTKVLNNKVFGLSGGQDVKNASFTTTYTSGSVSSVISALKQYSDLEVMSQPKIEAGNRAPTTFFDGATIPFLGSIQVNQQQTSVSTTGSVSYAEDGVRLSFIPDIISDTEVNFVLIPVLSSVGQKEVFNIGSGSQLTDFVRSKKEASISVSIEDGQTAIIGGLRSTKGTSKRNNIPGTHKSLALGRNDEASAREVVLLLHSKIIPGKFQETLFAESL